ncbi:MAG: O-antigen ligase family protein [Candidatus Omnitrophica bacterium]|nr:O-antigen ligase family protein [Candidatus Omnitrophota bacterium]MDE2222203.1 O-antigen ligase family protein [Candidatus Omnitrophota bacterium]
MDTNKGFDFGCGCDKVVFFAFCALIYFLPISIALTDTFAALAVFFYLLKKIHGLVLAWPAPGNRLFDKIKYTARGMAPAPSILKRPIAILALVTFLSVLQSQFLGVSFYAFGGKFLKYIFIYFSFVETFVTPKRMKVFVWVFLISAFLVCLSGVAQHIYGVDFLAGRHLAPDGRLSSSFKFPNSLGIYLVVVLAVVVQQLYVESLRKRFSWTLGGLLILLFLAMFCMTWTFSRAAWGGFMLSLFFLMFTGRGKILYLVLLLGLFLSFSLPLLGEIRHVDLTSNSLPHLGNPFNSIGHFESIDRINFWKSAIFIIKKYPALGSGLNTYALMLKKFSLPNWYAHNGYLQIGAETGLVGLSCFLWMLFVLFRQGIKGIGIGMGSWSNILLQAGLAGLLGFLGESFFDNSLVSVQLAVLFWLMTGFTVAVLNLNNKNEG